MFISAGGQLVTAADGTDPSGSGVITYIQPGNSLAGGQTQVLMAVAEEDEDGDQMQTKRVSSAVSSMVSGELQQSVSHLFSNIASPFTCHQPIVASFLARFYITSAEVEQQCHKSITKTPEQ